MKQSLVLSCMKKPILHTLLLSLLVALNFLVFSVVGILPAWAATSDLHTDKIAAEEPAMHNEADKSAKTKLLEVGARLLQDTTPVNQLQMYLDGFHNYKSEVNLPAEQQHQMRVAHYCQQLNEEFVQCAIYDGNTESAHLIGVEHIISDRIYQALPTDEKAYWHPHDSEADTGNLIAPGVPQPAHQALMDKVRTTHGKTWHVWQPDQDSLPFGEAKLMWAISPDQVNSGTKIQIQARAKSVKF